MTNVLIFGPPGIGKSTVIKRIARWIGDEHAIDLEEDRPRELLRRHGWDWMFNDGRLGGYNAIGAADLSPREKYPGTIKIVLTLDEGTYQGRRRVRDMINSAKASQPMQHVAEWRGIEDATYVEADDDAAYTILELMNRW